MYGNNPHKSCSKCTIFTINWVWLSNDNNILKNIHSKIKIKN